MLRIHILLALLSGYECPQTVIIDKVKTEWTQDDKAALDRATWVCANDERYMDTPCLIKFIKKKERWYNAICGVKRKKSSKNQ